jgi:hypothetical protein
MERIIERSKKYLYVLSKDPGSAVQRTRELIDDEISITIARLSLQ